MKPKAARKTIIDVLMTLALHLGLHWGMCVSLTGKALRLRRPSRVRRALLPALGGGIAAYGAIAFIRRELLAYMLVRTQFVFLDFSEPAPLFYLDYLAMMGMFVFAAHYGMKFLKRNRKKGFESDICTIDAACAEENV